MSGNVKTDEERDAEVIERAAAAMWWQEFGYDRGITWEQRVQQELDHRRDPSWSGPVARYRRLARAALSAIGSEGREHRRAVMSRFGYPEENGSPHEG